MLNRTVFISGSSRGIGRATAIEMAKSGYNLVLHGKTMSETLLKTLDEVKSFGVEARALAFDITDRCITQKTLLEDIETQECTGQSSLTQASQTMFPLPACQHNPGTVY